jgi:histone H3/H4
MTDTSDSNKEVLVVVSKLKNYIKNTAGLNTSGEVPSVLTKAVEILCQEAIESAKKDGRKTVMERDFKLPTSTETDSSSIN